MWEINNPQQITSLISKVLSSKTAKTDDSLFQAKQSLLMFKKYLIDLANSKDPSHPEWRTMTSVDDEIDAINKQIKYQSRTMNSSTPGINANPCPSR